MSFLVYVNFILFFVNLFGFHVIVVDVFGKDVFDFFILF